MSDAAGQWQLSQACSWSLTSPRIIGIINVTPDSFSDGGTVTSPKDAAAVAVRMVEEGAHMLDVGGESTRPGASRISVIEQINRVAPAIAAIRAAVEVPISIDTTRSEVAEAALDAGADVINDVSAGQEGDAMFALAAARKCGLILMHRLAPPDEDSYSDRYQTPPEYEDVITSVVDFLRERAQLAMHLGVSRDAIVIDPGLGFGKTVAQNYELITRAADLACLGFPVLCAASRKSFIGCVTGESKPRERVAGSVAAALAMFAEGVRLFRVHDVAAHRQALAVAETILKARELVLQEQGIALTKD